MSPASRQADAGVGTPGNLPSAPPGLLSRLEWRVRRAINSNLMGNYRSVFKGRGMEFDQVVKYQWGDDLRDIDWKVTARLGVPHRRQFIEERDLTVIVVFEDSPALDFGSAGRTRREVLLEAAALFMLLGGINRDRIALHYTSPAGAWTQRAAAGRRSVLRTASRLLEQSPAPLDGAAQCEPDWRILRRLAASGSVLLWFGPFVDGELPPRWRELQARYRTVGIRADDPWDSAMPRGLKFSAYDPLDGCVTTVDTSDPAQRRAHAIWRTRRDAYIENLFPRSADRLKVPVSADPLQALVEFFRCQAAVGPAR